MTYNDEELIQITESLKQEWIVQPEKQVTRFTYKSDLTLAEAKKKYPPGKYTATLTF